MIQFSSPAEAAAAFQQGAIFSAIVTLAMAATAAFAARSTKPVVGIKTIGIAAVVAYAALAGYNYWAAYGRFLAADVDADGIQLQYGGLQGRSIVLPREAIAAILVGQPGKADTQCHLAIQLKSGDIYRSAVLDKKSEACKDIRRQISATIAPAGKQPLPISV